MGTRTIIAGLRLGVVASLIELEVEVGQVEAALKVVVHGFRSRFEVASRPRRQIAKRSRCSCVR
jgi:hypothetical protein